MTIQGGVRSTVHIEMADFTQLLRHLRIRPSSNSRHIASIANPLTCPQNIIISGISEPLDSYVRSNSCALRLVPGRHKGIFLLKILGSLRRVRTDCVYVWYVYGAYVISNCLFDQSAPRQYKVDVVDKKIGSGRTTTYHVVVGPWGQEAEPRKLTVTGSEFNRLKKGDTVVLHLKKGLFGTPWLYAATESATRGESE